MVNKAEDAKMLRDVPYPMNDVMSDQLVLNLVDVSITRYGYYIHRCCALRKFGKLITQKSSE